MIKIGCEKVKKASGTVKKASVPVPLVLLFNRTCSAFPYPYRKWLFANCRFAVFLCRSHTTNNLEKNRQDFELELYRVMEQEKRTIM